MILPKIEKKKPAGKSGLSVFLRRRPVLIASCLILIVVLWNILHLAKKKPAQPQGMPVIAAKAIKGEIGVYINGLGNVTPINTITVKSRVDGQLMKILFQDGQLVKSGDPLFEIDSRPFQAQLVSEEGQMARDLALLANARLDLQRYHILFKEDSVSKQQLDTQKSLVHQFEGAVKVDRGQIDNAKLQLFYSRIKAPLSGRVGLHLVDIGNIIHVTDTGGLVAITQLQPIKVIFTIPEDDIPRVLDKMKGSNNLSVEAYDREQVHKLATGSLIAIDNLIDPTTGTVRCESEFPNENNALFPNQFVNAKLLLETRQDATIIPAVAIQQGPQGTYVYVVKTDKTAQVRMVKIGITEADMVSIDSGLSPDELVVVDGAERLRDGSKVEAQIQASISSGG